MLQVLYFFMDDRYSSVEGGVAPARAKVTVRGKGQKHFFSISVDDMKNLFTSDELDL